MCIDNPQLLSDCTLYLTWTRVVVLCIGTERVNPLEFADKRARETRKL